MGSACRRASSRGVIVLGLGGFLALAAPAFAKIPRETPRAPQAKLLAADSWVGKLLGTCVQQGNWILYKPPGAKETKKLPVSECTLPDGQGKEFMSRLCIPIAGTMTLIEKPATCGKNQMCYVGVCKYPKLEILPAQVCSDSDHPDPTFPWIPPTGSGLPSPTLPPDDPQIFQPGNITVSKGAKKTQDYADSCKGPLLIESVCTGAGPQQSQQVKVKCPPNFQCDPQAEMNGITGAACDEICPPPFVDVCSDPGCQQLLIECEDQPPDPCSPIDPANDYPNATIFGSPGNWHIDICLPDGSDVVGHYQCKEGKSNLGITKCEPPDLCFNGLCNGEPPPEPEPQELCADSDPPIPPLGKPFGNPTFFGGISIQGAGLPAANDYCDKQNPYMVWQAKCSPTDPEGYTFGTNPTLCPNDPDGTALVCISGVCVKPSPCQCEAFSDNGVDIPGKAAGTKQDGKPFTAYDQCQGDLLLEAMCEPSSVDCHVYAPTKCVGEEDKIEVCVSVPLGGICKPVDQATCSDTDVEDDKYILGEVSGINKLGEKFEKKDYCVPAFGYEYLEQAQCDTTSTDGYTFKPLDCSPGFCLNGICTPCLDEDPKDSPYKKGLVFVEGEPLHTDYCLNEGEKLLIQASCDDKGALVFGKAEPCPDDTICLLGACVPPNIDKCGGVVVPSDGNVCTTDTCNPATGAPQYNPAQDGTTCDDSNLCTEATVCVAGKCGGGTPVVWDDKNPCTIDSCAPKSGISHLPIVCPAGKTCSPKTGTCEKQILCNGNGVVDLPTEECDKADLDGMTCQDLESIFSGGALACNASCKFDTSGCYVCGNAKYEPTEECEKNPKKYEPAILPKWVQCQDFFPAPATGEVDCDPTTCKFIFICKNPGDPYGSPPKPETPLNTTLPPAACGNWVVDPGEECDKKNVAMKTCKELGYGIGWVTCTPECKLSTKTCYGTPEDPYGPSPDPDYVPTCGNGIKDVDEACEWAKHPVTKVPSPPWPKLCQELGFYSGVSICNENCELDYSMCYGTPGNPFGGTQHCGDGILNPGEECDIPPWSVVKGPTIGNCSSLGYYGGSVKCVGCKYDYESLTCYGWSSDPYGKPPG